MRRLGALLGAVVMVVAAFAVRGAVTDDTEVATGGTVAEPGRVVCPVDFEDLCDDLPGAVTVEEAGLTADRLVEATSVADLGAGAWITPAAWARLVMAERERLDREPLFEIADEPIASSPVVLAVWTEHATELSSLCGQEAVDWSCIAAQAGQPVLGSPVRPGSPPVDSGTGLVVAAAQAGSLLGTSDYAANDFAGEFSQLAARLAAKQVPRPLSVMRTKGPGELTAVGVVGADAGTVLTTNFGTIVVLDDRPPLVRADVVAWCLPAPTSTTNAVTRCARRSPPADGTNRPMGPTASPVAACSPPSARSGANPDDRQPPPRRSTTDEAIRRPGPGRRDGGRVVHQRLRERAVVRRGRQPGGGPRRLPGGRCRHLAREDRPALGVGRGLLRIRAGRDRGRRVHRRRGPAEGVRRCRPAPRRGLGRGRGRTPSGHLVAGLDGLGHGAERAVPVQRPGADRQRRHAVHADPAGHRHAPAHGQALGWPDEALGWSDILELARSAQGWADYGHPEWGAFRLGKTNPNFSTSGLSALIAQTYAAADKTTGLSAEDLAKPEVIQYGSDVESAVVHYGDTTLTFLNNWYRADQRGNPYVYVSAAAVEEKSVIDYNQGNPDGVLDQGEEPRPPRVPLVSIYPEEGTLYSDNPLIVLDAEWVSEEEKAAAARFVDFVQRPENQEKVLQFGFRPGNPDVAVGAPINAENGADPTQPRTLLEVPPPAVTVEVLDAWATQRKSARVTLVIDVSGSMGTVGDEATGETKLDLAKRAAIEALDEFKDDDQVGLRVFTTDLDAQGATFIDLVSAGRVGDVRENLANRIRDLVPLNGTPLYDVANATYEQLATDFDPARINAMVLLTDGQNDDGDTSDDSRQLDTLIENLSRSAEGSSSRPVRVFAIGYGADADLSVLRRIAEASNGAVYDASDPRSITKVFTAVVSNF